MNKTARKWIDLLAIAALATLTVVFFWKIALTNRILAGLDVFAYFYPYRELASEALQAGKLPLWNPYLFMGAPLLANSQAAVLYPLHWPLIWLSAPKQVAWSIVLHIWLAGTGTYLFARSTLKLHPFAAFTAAIVFTFGGFLGAQVEHINQLNASAWLPWLLICIEGVVRPGRQRWLALLGGAAIVALTLLAGHTQAAYIVLSGAGIYALLRGIDGLRERQWIERLRGIGALATMSLLGALLAAGQLLPTLELSRMSVRSGGLPYNEAASFSLRPSLVFKAFLPPLIWEPPFSEYVAYIGLIGLALAGFGAWRVLKGKRPGREALILALIGVFLALGAYNPIYYLLYKAVPGFSLFRVPARWLLLYGFGMALLAGVGLEILPRRRLLVFGTGLLLLVELFAAGRQLAYNTPTSPIAYNSMRTAPAHLLADAGAEPFRFLSMSDMRYDPGDMGELQAMYESALSEQALYDLIVATKMKEVLAYNLPMHYMLPSIDGYDGGLLPIDNYVTLEKLFLSEDEIWPDGRLRQQLRYVPQARLLSLLNVKYVITDKTQDVWIDNVFYDLEHTVPLGEVVLSDLPDIKTTHVGIVSYLAGAQGIPNGTPVASLTLADTRGVTVTLTLRAGEQTAEGVYIAGQVAHSPARVGHQWRDNQPGNDYIAVLEVGTAIRPESIEVRSLFPDEKFQLRGITLIDGHSGTSRNLSIDPAYKLVHSGDVKIYQNLAVQPRAFVVHGSRIASDDRETLAILQLPDFDPGREVLLDKGRALQSNQEPTPVHITDYQPERIQMETVLDSPGYLVLTNTDYPGWDVTVDGHPTSIQRADVYFQAIELEPGSHQITFRFAPASLQIGLGIGLAAWLVWVLVAALAASRIGRKGPSSV